VRTFNQPARNGSTENCRQAVLRRFAQRMRHTWGVRYFKLDACYWGAVRGGYHDPGATRVEAYRAAGPSA
jgi:hypothetical protein